MLLHVIFILFLTNSFIFWSDLAFGQDADTEYDPLLLFPDNNLNSEFNEDLPAIEVVRDLILSEIDDYPYIIARSNFVNFGECTTELRNKWSQISAKGEIFAYPFSTSELRLYKSTHLEIHYCNSSEMIIFVDENGENEIIIHPGANNKFSKSQCFEILENFTSKDTWVVLQNEINLSVEIAAKAKELGFKVCYSAAPFDSDHARKMLPHIDLLAMNETELKELQKSLGENVFNLDIDMILVTLGSQGAELHLGNSIIKQSSFVNKAVDTTGAGDTFLGSFIACYDNGYDTEKALEYAAAASSIQITRIGAARAIPTFEEVQDFINERKE